MPNENENIEAMQDEPENGEELETSGIDAVLNKIDELSATEDNSAEPEGAADRAEEAPTVQMLQNEIKALKADYNKAVSAIEKMVVLYGARMTDDNSQGVGVEAFKTAKVEQTFPDSVSTDGVSLDQIVLGS